MRPDEEKTQQEKLGEEIDNLKTRIKNTEYDLENMFKGNAFLEKKLDNSKKELGEKQVLLEKIKSQPGSAKELSRVEKKIVEPETEAITGEQEEIVKELVEGEV